MKKEKKYLIENIELMSEWDWEKNNQQGLNPEKLFAFSHEEAYWLCKYGHSWKTRISQRSRGYGCHYCSGRYAVTGVNDLETLYPKLAREWDYDKNTLLPSQVKPKSSIPAWWKCQKGHSWPAIISARTRGNGCPFCSGREVIEGKNDLLSQCPWLADEWDYEKNLISPSEIAKSSGKRVYWKCKTCGNSWPDTINHRYSGRNCPKCFGEKHTSFPEQAILFYMQKSTMAYGQYKFDDLYEIDIYLPEYKVGIEYDGMAFHSSAKSEEREQRKNDYLSKKNIRLIRIKETKTKIFELHENIIFYKPDVNYTNLPMIIENLHEKIFKKRIDFLMDIQQDRALIYQNYIYRYKDESFGAKFPQLAKEWHPTQIGDLTPNHFTYGTKKSVFWLCPSGHTYPASIAHRINGTGCPYCAGKKVWIGFNDLASQRPDLAKEWHPKNKIKPTEITVGYNKKVWWLCPSGHEYEADPKHRASGTACSVCAGKKIIVGFNDFASQRPELLLEWNPTKNLPLLPTQVSKSSGTKVWWICKKCKNEWPARINKRAMGRGCPKCAKNRKDK